MNDVVPVPVTLVVLCALDLFAVGLLLYDLAARLLRGWQDK